MKRNSIMNNVYFGCDEDLEKEGYPSCKKAKETCKSSCYCANCMYMICAGSDYTDNAPMRCMKAR